MTVWAESSTTNRPRVTSQNARLAAVSPKWTVVLAPGASGTRWKPRSWRSGCLTRERRCRV